MKSSTITLYLFLVILTALLFVGGFAIHHLNALGAKFQAQTAMRLVLAAGLAAVTAQMVLVFRSMISKLKQDHALVEELTRKLDQFQTIDELTKAYNRHMLEQVLGREVESVRRYHADVAGIMFDVDGFRLINEKHGYKSGDKLLYHLARIIRRSIRKTDYLFRWRGGRFIVLAVHVNVEQATQFAEKLRRTVEKTDFGGVKLTISLGLTSVRGEDTTESFVGRLKQALLSAKEQGPNHLQVLDAA